MSLAGSVIQITKNHIKKGKPEEPTSCAIAYALKHQGIKRVDVYVDLNYIMVGNEVFKTPANAAKFIKTYDNYLTTEDAEPFVLRLPKKAYTLEHAKAKGWLREDEAGYIYSLE